MNWLYRVLLVALVTVAVCFGQSTIGHNGSVSVVKAEPPQYPPLAHSANLPGDVKVAFTIKPDGSIASFKVVSGNPLLSPAVLNSARTAQFACNECLSPQEFVVVYRFRINAKIIDCCAGSFQKIEYPSEPPTPGQIVITTEAEPFCTCCTAGTLSKRPRTAKCLYLWRCGH